MILESDAKIVVDSFVKKFSPYFELPISFEINIETTLYMNTSPLNDIKLADFSHIVRITTTILFPESEEIILHYQSDFTRNNIHTSHIEFFIGENEEPNFKSELYSVEDTLLVLFEAFDNKLKETKLDKYFKITDNINNF